MTKKSIVKCFSCGNEFEKENRYIKTAEKKNRNHYCSLACLGKDNLIRGKEKIDKWNKSEENKTLLKSICSNGKDEYTGFRTLLSSCFKRKKECDLDLPYLKEVWTKQNGKCAITGVDLQLKSNYNKNYQASIDRIDSAKGYIKGNIRFISVSVNWLKNDLDDNHLREFFQICNGSKLII